MKQIIVGGREVMVPRGYIQAETEFTKSESAIFYALDDGPKKEEARAIVLEKRLEFYYLYLAGEADLPEIEEPPKRGFWYGIARALRDHQWRW